MDLREFPSVLPLHFFDLELEFEKGEKPTLIEGHSEFLGEECFSEVRMGVSDGGIQLEVKVHKTFEKASFPDVDKGDGMEFFIDTRGIQSALIMHKYCHHFVFLPKEVDGVQAVEVTRFKTNDKRELAPKELLKVKTNFAKNHYTLQIDIPDTALFGYDLTESTTLKIAYIIHSASHDPNHYPKSGIEFSLKDHPSLWATFQVTTRI